MFRMLDKLVAIGAALLLVMVSFAPANAQTDATFSLGNYEVANSGDPVTLNIGFAGPSNTGSINFFIVYDAAAKAVFAPVIKSGTTIDCSRGANVATGVNVTVKLQSASNRISVVATGQDPVAGVINTFNITNDVLATCKFTALGSGPIACNSAGAAGVINNEDGTQSNQPLTADCVGGSFTVTGGGLPTATATTGVEVPTATATTAVEGPTATATTAVATATATTAVATATKTTAVATATKTTAVATATPSRTATSAPTATKTPVSGTVISAGASKNAISVTLTDAGAFPASGTVSIPTDAGAQTVSYTKAGNVLTLGVPLQGNVAGGAVVTLVSSGGGAPAAGNDEDGCQIGTTGGYSGAWLLLIPAVGLLVMRRRHQ